MKIVFNNVPAEIIAIVSEGNYWMKDCNEMHVNKNQQMLVEGTTVIITGERCALWGDYFKTAMEAIQEAGLIPDVYETSDKRLQWHDTLESYLCTRGTDEEILQEFLEKPESTSVFQPILKLLQKAIDCPIGSETYRRASAEGNLPSKAAYAALKEFTKKYEMGADGWRSK